MAAPQSRTPWRRHSVAGWWVGGQILLCLWLACCVSFTVGAWAALMFMSVSSKHQSKHVDFNVPTIKSQCAFSLSLWIHDTQNRGQTKKKRTWAASSENTTNSRGKAAKRESTRSNEMVQLHSAYEGSPNWATAFGRLFGNMYELQVKRKHREELSYVETLKRHPRKWRKLELGGQIFLWCRLEEAKWR